jgi:hypothetical protein
MDTSENPRKPTKNNNESEEESDEDGKYFDFRYPIEVTRELFQLGPASPGSYLDLNVDPVKIGTELCEERQREISVYNSFSENN